MKFKCIYSGQVYEFTQEQDIKTMKEHPEYQEVVVEEVEPSKPAAKKTVKQSVNNTEE